MYRFFTFNSPINIVLYAVLFLALQTGWWLKVENVNPFTNHAEPLSAMLAGLMAKFSIPLRTLKVAGFITALLSGVLVNRIVWVNKITPQRSYVAGAVFLVLLCLVKDFALLSPQLMALLLGVRLLQKMFSLYGAEKPFGDIFDMGWLSSLAMLFYFPAFWFLIFSIIGLAILRPFSLREWWMVLIGFFSPLFVVFTFFFWHDETGLLAGRVMNLSNIDRNKFTLETPEITAFSGLAVLAAFALTSLPRILFSSVIQVRKFTTVLLLSGAFCLFSFFMQTKYGSSHFVFMCLPIGILTAMFLQSLKSIFMPELIFGLLISCVLFVQYVL